MSKYTKEFKIMKIIYEKKLQALFLKEEVEARKKKIILKLQKQYPKNKVNEWIEIAKLPKSSYYKDLTIHSDQGFHYQHSTWTKKLEKMNIRQSMSRKGNCLDNSLMENFFGILKQEMYYGENFKSYEHLRNEIEKYIRWYNEDRIKTKLNQMSSVMYRLHFA